MIITFISASTALIAGIASPVVSIIVARRQFNASVISNNRERWIEVLRDSVAEYISLVTSAVLMARRSKIGGGEIVYEEQQLLKTAERIMLVRSRIVLMTNPTKDMHRDLCQIIEAVHGALVSNALDMEQWRSHINAITLAGQAVFEAEWVRVKRGD